MPLGEGEHPNGRKAIDTMTKRLVDGGTPADKAKKIATEAAIREDKRRNR